MSEQPKWALQSKTILGALLAMLVVVLPSVGVSFSGDDSALISDTLDKVIELAGLALAVYGRFTATQTITATP